MFIAYAVFSICKTRVCGFGGRSLKCFVARAGNVAFGNLGLNPAQQSHNLPRVVVIEDSLKGCLCVIHPYVL